MYKQVVFIVTFAAITLTGCSSLNTFNAYYRTYHPLRTAAEAVPAPEDEAPVIRTGSSMNVDYIRMLQGGYVPIGYSRYRAAFSASTDALESVAKHYRAVLVLTYTKDLGRNQIVVPLTTPTQTYSTTNSNATLHDNRGNSLYGSGSSTTTTYGNTTTYYPLSFNEYDFVAVYWARATATPLEAYLGDIPTALRSRADTNRGAYVLLVVNNGPAYEADIVQGDIILSVNGKRVDNWETAQRDLARYSGLQSIVQVWHDGKIERKSVTLNTLPSSAH